MSVTHPLLPPISATLFATTGARMRGDGVEIDLREALAGEGGPLLARLMWSAPSTSVAKVASLLDYSVIAAWATLLDDNPVGMVITKVNHDALKTWVFNEAWDKVLSNVLVYFTPTSLVATPGDGEVEFHRKKTIRDYLDVVLNALIGERSIYQADWPASPRGHDAFIAHERCSDLWEAVVADVSVLLQACAEALKTAVPVVNGAAVAPDKVTRVLWNGLRFGGVYYVIGECRGGLVMDLVRARAYRLAGVPAHEARTTEFGDPAGVPSLEALHLLGALTP